MELARRHGDYAIVGIAVQGRVDGGDFDDMRLGFFGAGISRFSPRARARH